MERHPGGHPERRGAFDEVAASDLASLEGIEQCAEWSRLLLLRHELRTP
jgi:hypothetical protein